MAAPAAAVLADVHAQAALAYQRALQRLDAQTDHARRLRSLATEYIQGKWVVPGQEGAEPAAVVTYATEPSPETGHVGWVWWAHGKMGEAASYEQACLAAEAVVRRRQLDKESRP